MRTRAERPVQPFQVKNIHILKQALGLDDETYRLVLSGFIGRDGEPVTSSKQLTFRQAGELTSMWLTQCRRSGITVYLARGETVESRASDQQIKGIHYHAIACSITYADLAPFHIGTGKIIGGDELRTWLQRRFDAKERIPPNCMGPLWEWIDQKTNAMLVQGGFLTRAGSSKVYWRQLSADAGNYLIIRWREMHEQIVRRGYKMPYAEPTYQSLN